MLSDRAPLRTGVRNAAASVAAALAMAAAPAAAGEYYSRAGIGLGRAAEATFTDRDCSSESPAALYGCGIGGDGAPYRSRGGLGTAAAFEVGLGRAVSSAVRLEAAIDYRGRFNFDGRTNFLAPGRRQSVAADVSSVSAMASVYLDLPRLRLGQLGSPGFFVGAGAGVARNRIAETRMTFPATTTVVPGGSRSGFAWMAVVGVGTALGPRTTLEIEWRYRDAGEVRTDPGEGRVIWRDGRRGPLLLDLAPTQAQLVSKGLRLSLRYGL